jgi:hypothetical protein
MSQYRGKIQLINTQEAPLTASFNAASLTSGASYAANSLHPDLYTAPVDAFTWNYDSTKYVTASNTFDWLSKSKTKTRDHEITVNVGMGTIFLRVDDTGRAWFLNYNYNNGLFRIGICTDANSSGSITEDFTGSYGLVLNEGAPFTGFYQSSSATESLTFGCSGFELYVKFNGVEKFRYKFPHHCKPGYAGVKLFADAASYLRIFTYQSFSRAFTYSLTNSNTVDIRDFGAIPNSKTTGNMIGGNTTLTVADGSKFPIGSTVIVATGGEASWMGRTGIGTIGVGGVYPALHYANATAMQADRSKPDAIRCFVDDTGLCYVNSVASNTWFIASETYYVAGEPAITNPYDQYAIQVALRAKITAKTGNILTLDKTAAVSTTDAEVFLDSSYAFSRLLIDPVESYFRTDYPEAIQFNFSIADIPGRKVHCPEGEYYWGEDVIFTAHDIEWYGDGNDKTIFITPNGASAFNVFAKGPTRSIARDFKCIGNTRTSTYSGRWEAWYGDTAARINNQYYNITNGHSTPWGFGYLNTDDAIAQNITFVDIWWLACGMKQLSNGCYRKNVRIERTAPLLCYVQWFGQDGTCFDGIFEDCSFDSDWLHPAFESFDSENSQFINCTMRNGILSFNNAGHFSAIGCTQTFDGINPRPSWMHPSGPAVNVNTNIGANKFVGLIRDHTIIQTGYQDASNNCIIGIVVNSANQDITIENCSYTGMPKSTGYGPRALTSTGINVTVDGFVATGTIPGDGFYNCNVAVQDGTVKNVVAPSIYVYTGVTLGTGPDANVGTITVI